MRRYVLPLTALLVALCSTMVVADDTVRRDLRLDKKVTLDCVNVRLYTALDRISAETGVTIRAGRNTGDWPARDMPVLVCARDIPLGKLLQGIADATHLLLSESRLDGKPTYRIWRDLKREKEISDFEESRLAAARAAASNDWDALSKVKDIPDDAIKSLGGSALLRESVLPMSNLTSRLGPGARDRVLDGEKVVFCMANAPDALKPYVMACIQSFYDMTVRFARERGEPAPKPLDQMLGVCRVSFEFGRFGHYPDQLCASISLEGVYTEISPGFYQGYVQRAMPDVSPRPKVPDPKLRLDDIDPRYKKLSLSQGGPSFLDLKLKLEPPKDGKRQTYSDLLCAVSKATGYSIVAEGNAARYAGLVMSLDKDLNAMLAGKEITVRDALAFGTGLNREVWYLDANTRLIVGRDAEWIESVKSLVSEKLLRETSAKLNGKGMDLDDLAPLAGLTDEQWRAWIYDCEEYPDLHAAHLPLPMGDSSLWALYFALNPSDRATARSGKPVDLSGLDRARTCSVMRKYLAKVAERSCLNGRAAKTSQSLEPGQFANLDSAPALSLWIEKQELPEVKGKDYYTVHVKSQKDGSTQEITERLEALFPIFALGKDPVMKKLRGDGK